MINQVKQQIDRALGRIRLAFRGVLSQTNSAPNVMLVSADALSGEPLKGVEYFQHFGLTSRPPKGSMMVAVPLGGKTAHAVVIATEHGSYRIKSLEEGEVALYDDQGQSIQIKRDRIVIKTPKTFEVVADKIDLHAATEFKFDVNGQGEKWDGQGVETWRDDDQPRPTHNHMPPRIP